MTAIKDTAAIKTDANNIKSFVASCDANSARPKKIMARPRNTREILPSVVDSLKLKMYIFPPCPTFLPSEPGELFF